MFKFNVRRFLDDCGGVAAAAQKVGKARTAAYGWIERGRMNSDDIALLKGLHPKLDLNAYVQVDTSKAASTND